MRQLKKKETEKRFPAAGDHAELFSDVFAIGNGDALNEDHCVALIKRINGAAVIDQITSGDE